jgi:biopolymer transport protein ExbD/biopolymer transport protein TolR
MAFGTSATRGVKSHINITPLVDVVLVLLIIFMVVTPMLERGKTVDLPYSRTSDPERGNDAPLVISVTADGRAFVGDKMGADGQLAAALSRELAAHPGRKLLLKADKSLPVGTVRDVLIEAQKAGAAGVALGVREREVSGP